MTSYEKLSLYPSFCQVMWLQSEKKLYIATTHTNYIQGVLGNYYTVGKRYLGRPKISWAPCG